MKRKKRAARKPPKPSPQWLWLERWLPLLVLLTLPALVVAPQAKDSFRLPKLLLSEVLALLSVCILVWRLRAVERIDFSRLWRHPAVVALVPMLLVATSGLLTSAHPLHVRQGLVSLWVAAVCLVAWSLALRPGEHRRIQIGLLLPATVLSLIAVGQFHGLFEIFHFKEIVKARIGVTSLAGGAFDLGGFLVLPALIAQLLLRREENRRRRWVWGLVLVLCVYTIALTQTLTAIAALVVASFVLWAGLLPWRRLLAAMALVAVLVTALGFAVAPLRERIVRKARSVAAGNVGDLLTGRLDGWRAAVWMIEQHPWVGVGHGAYKAEFGAAKLALREAGRGFYTRQHQTHFSNAHNEALEVAAEWGFVGCLAVLWAMAVVLRRLWQRQRSVAGAGGPHRGEVALMWAGVAALAVLSLTLFPLRIALVAYPYLLLFAWILGRREEQPA